MNSNLKNRRMLLIDSTPSIHQDLRKILLPDTSAGSALDAVR
ncbi:hypothetical protein [Pseudomonas frederiksbergensis]